MEVNEHHKSPDMRQRFFAMLGEGFSALTCAGRARLAIDSRCADHTPRQDKQEMNTSGEKRERFSEGEGKSMMAALERSGGRSGGCRKRGGERNRGKWVRGVEVGRLN